MQMEPEKESLRQLWDRHHQAHVFRYLDQISHREKKSLFRQLAHIDIGELNTIWRRAEQTERDIGMSARISPIDSVALDESSAEAIARWKTVGESLISHGNMAALVLAGGQGSRLGSSLPKGVFNMGLLSEKSLFQIHAERILKAQLTLSAVIPLYVMTSEATDVDTRKFFQMNQFFGLKEKDVIFFKQEMLPAVDFEGNVIMENPHTVFLAPCGNGGLYKALLDHGILDDMKARGIKWVSQYCVDNVLCQVVDAVFLGFAAETQFQVVCKAVEKVDVNEKIGVFALKNGKPTVVEYSEISSDLAKARDRNGKLLLRCGHICENLFQVSFLERAATERLTKYHIAKKKIPFTGIDGRLTVPTKDNGMKFEQFIFDPFEHLPALGVLLVHRDSEFAALKNATNTDCPETSRAAVTQLHKKWIMAAGGKVVDARVPEECQCEVSPLVSLNGEGLEEIVMGKEFTMPFEITVHRNSGRVVVKNWSFAQSSLKLSSV